MNCSEANWAGTRMAWCLRQWCIWGRQAAAGPSGWELRRTKRSSSWTKLSSTPNCCSPPTSQETGIVYVSCITCKYVYNMYVATRFT